MTEKINFPPHHNEHEGDGGWMDMDDAVHPQWRAMWEEVWDTLEGTDRLHRGE